MKRTSENRAVFTSSASRRSTHSLAPKETAGNHALLPSPRISMARVTVRATRSASHATITSYLYWMTRQLFVGRPQSVCALLQHKKTHTVQHCVCCASVQWLPTMPEVLRCSCNQWIQHPAFTLTHCTRAFETLCLCADIFSTSLFRAGNVSQTPTGVIQVIGWEA